MYREELGAYFYRISALRERKAVQGSLRKTRLGNVKVFQHQQMEKCHASLPNLVNKVVHFRNFISTGPRNRDS